MNITVYLNLCFNSFCLFFSSFTDKCAKVRCPFGATCEDGDCVCPQVCAADFEPLCASNGQIYANECEMKKDACLKKTELYIVNNGPCDEISGSGLGENRAFLF